MPKLKTHKSTAKRVKRTAGGKLLRERAFGHHRLARKSGGRKRLISSEANIIGKAAKNIKRALGV